MHTQTSPAWLLQKYSNSYIVALLRKGLETSGHRLVFAGIPYEAYRCASSMVVDN